MTQEDKRDLGYVGIIMTALMLVFATVTWNVFWDVLRDPAAYERKPAIKYIVLRPMASDARSGVPRTDAE